MKNYATVVLIAAVVGGLAGYIAQLDFRATKKIANATIVFYGPEGSCKAKASPDPISPEKNYSIDWTIVDLCGLAADAVVTLTWIANAENGATGPDPLENVTSTPKKRIKGDLKGTVAEGNKFTYQILLNGTVVGDPDVEIVQF